MILPINSVGVYNSCAVPMKRTSLPKEPVQSCDYASDFNAAQALKAQRLVSFTQSPVVKTKKVSVNIDLKNYPIEPQGSINITPNKKIPAKQGIFPVYSMALNDSFVNEAKKLEGIKTLYPDIQPNNIKLYLKSDQKNFNAVMNTVDGIVFDSKISAKKFEEAKQLAPVALFLNRKGDAYPEYFKDIPADMSEESYEKLISNISFSDVINYNKEITNNSNININLILNKDYYEKNKDSINLYLNKWGI